MVTAEELAARARVVRDASDLRALLEHLRERAQPVIDRMPAVPEHKALISIDGGRCPDDAAHLTFDPWSPTEHRCPRCGKTWRGERHDRHWARLQHLWLVERAGHLAALAGIGEDGDKRAASRARDILQVYAERYWRYPNRDNLLGPSRLFFSTYLESLWICSYLAAAALLRASDQLDDATTRGVNQVAEEAATLIGDYDEAFSNRQIWNNAALAAVAVWFEDEELAQRAIEGDTGLIAHLVRGFGRDGMWYEGENYHLFALRGLLTGAAWARMAGVDICGDERLMPRLQAALQAPALTALPDYTFPARKDARFGISLAQPPYLELWEIGLAKVGTRDTGNGKSDELVGWLRVLYERAQPPVRDLLESYLHDAPVSTVPCPVSRSTLSFWALLDMVPELPPAETPWQPRSVLLESQGLAILRRENRYVGLECGPHAGGHGHPDRLHLTLHADGVHWLPDPGTGSYTTRDLFWYRSTLAHNAPRLDGESQAPGNATCECFDDQGDWAWVRGQFDTLNRIVMAAPAYIVDVTDMSAPEDHLLELSWHIAGRGTVETKGRWVDDELRDEFATRAQRFVPHERGEPIVLTHVQDRAQLTLHLVFDGDLVEMEGPGLPGQKDRAKFYVARARRRNVRVVSVLEVGSGAAVVKSVQVRGDSVDVNTTSGVDRHRFTYGAWTIEQEGQAPRTLSGARESRPPFVPLLQIDPPTPVAGTAFQIGATPPLDGTLRGFELAEPLHLALEDQYRRSEDGYPGPDEFSAEAYAAWDERALYLAVEVTKPEVCLRPDGAQPLRLDNEPDDIHSDGVQVYLAPDGASVGYLIVPNQGGHSVRAHLTSDTRTQRAPAVAAVTGGWRRTDSGYCVTVAIPWPEGMRPHAGGRVAFDLIVNEMLPGRVRRAGQLVWSGGGGWVWLRADRQDPSRFGVLELVG